MDMVVWEDYLEEWRGRSCDMDMYTQGEDKKTNNEVKWNENEQSQIYANQMKIAKKINRKKWAKNQCTKMYQRKHAITTQHSMQKYTTNTKID